MMLRNSLSKTKYFFQKTLQNFKSLISGGYQRLPKTPPFISCGCGGRHYLKNLHQSCRDHEHEMEPMKDDELIQCQQMEDDCKGGGESKEDEKKREIVRQQLSHYYLISRKLRELELMDMSDMEHILDIEEVIHFYSRLTCPIYLEIFDKFFLQIYSEFFLSLNKHQQ